MAKPTPSKETVRRTVHYRKMIDKHGPALRKLIPGFDKLPKKMQGKAANRKNLQQYYPDDEVYSDEGITAMVLGLASMDFHSVGKDSAGRKKSLGEVKKLAPSGYNYGGKVHRGRRAQGNKA